MSEAILKSVSLSSLALMRHLNADLFVCHEELCILALISCPLLTVYASVIYDPPAHEYETNIAHK